MPYRRRYRKRRKFNPSRRRYRRKYRARRRRLYSSRRRLTTRVPRVLQTDTLFVKLPYQDSRGTIAGISVAWFNEYQLNGLYDPYVSGVGGSVNGFARYMAFFKYYTVHAVMVSWDGLIDSPKDTLLTVGMIPAYPADTGLRTVNELHEQPRAYIKSVSCPTTSIDSADADYGSKHFRMKRFYNLRSIIGPNFRANTFRGEVSSNPTSGVNLYLRMIEPAAYLSASRSMHYTLKLVFYVQFHQRLNTSV